MIAARILGRKTLFGFAIVMLISLTTANLVFTIVYGFTTSLTHSFSGFSRGVILLQEGAKSIHTSRVPLSLAKSLSMLPNVEAHAATLTPVTLAGKPIVFRGVGTFNDYAGRIIEGSLPLEQGSWVLLGEKACRRLGLGVGDIVVVGSPSASKIVALYVAGIYRFGELRDCEAVVSHDIGAELAGLPSGVTSAIQVDGIEKEDLQSLVKGLYTLVIHHGVEKGRVDVLDSLNSQVVSFALEGPGAEILQLPFGHYTMVYREFYVTANLTSILLTENQTLTLKISHRHVFNLKVVVPETQAPTLQLENGSLIQGSWIDGTWLFKAPQGLHTLKLDEAAYLIFLMGDTTFNPQAVEEGTTRVKIRVQWQNGADVEDCLVSVKSTSEASRTLYTSIRSLTASVILNLPEGEYEAEVSKPPYLVRVQFKIPEQQVVTVSLPRISNPSRVTPKLFQQLKAVTPIDASTTTLASLIGLTTTALTALMASLTVLSIMAVFTVQRSLYASAKDNIDVLRTLGAEKRQILRMIGPQTFLLNVALGLGATCLALTIHECAFCNHAFTIFGYSLQAEPSLTFAYSSALCIASWFLSLVKSTPGTSVES